MTFVITVVVKQRTFSFHHQLWNELGMDILQHQLHQEVFDVCNPVFLECLHGIRIVNKEPWTPMLL